MNYKNEQFGLKKVINEDFLLRSFGCFWICSLINKQLLVWYVRTTSATGKTSSELGFAKVTHSHALQGHCKELLLYAAYVRLRIASPMLIIPSSSWHGSLLLGPESWYCPQMPSWTGCSEAADNDYFWESSTLISFCFQAKMAQMSPFHLFFTQTRGLELEEENRPQQLLLHYFAQKYPKTANFLKTLITWLNSTWLSNIKEQTSPSFATFPI